MCTRMKTLLLLVHVLFLSGITELTQNTAQFKRTGHSTLGSSEGSEGDLYDVTTIYRLDSEPWPDNQTVIPIEPCFVDNDCNRWNWNGWWPTQSGNFPDVFPLQDEVTASLDELPHVTRLPETGINFLVKPCRTGLATCSRVFLYLMNGEDAAHADMFVLVIETVKDDGFRGFVYQCSPTQTGTSDGPNTKPRRNDCQYISNKEFGDRDRGSDYVFNIAFIGGQIRVFNLISMTYKILFASSVPSYKLEDGIFVGMKTNNPPIKYGTPTKFFALTENHSKLSTSLSNRLSSRLCLQMWTYLHPDSKANVKVFLTPKLLLGEIKPTENKVETWRFIANIEEEGNQLEIVIKGNKGNTFPVLIGGITSCNDTGAITNTVIHKAGSTEAHARTNSQGLPLRLSNGTITGSTFETDGGLLECWAASEQRCPWQRKSFAVTALRDDRPALLQSWETITSLLLTNQYDFEHQRLGERLSFVFTATGGYSRFGWFNIVLSDDRQDIDDSDLHVVAFPLGQGSCHVYRCPAHDGGVTVALSDVISRNCTEEVVQDMLRPPVKEGTTASFTVERRGGGLEVSVVDTATWESLGRVQVPADPAHPMETTHFSLWKTDDSLQGILGNVVEYPVANLTGEVGSLVSPPLSSSPQSGRVCASLVFLADPGSKVELHLQHDNEVLDTRQATATGEWDHQTFTWDIPSGEAGEIRVVVTATRTGKGTVYIQRVAGCSVEDDVDFLLVSEDEKVTIWNSGIDIAHSAQYTVLGSEGCSNGGLMVQWDNSSTSVGQCICPAGFNGTTCERGCGPNRFGADCEGLCSKSDRRCKGMILCLPKLGCNCAPGFKGFDCTQECSEGEFGPGCGQRCGLCSREPCDVYTGVCKDWCKPGRFPPYCKDFYSHLAEAPVVQALGYHEIAVYADLEKTSGQGNPTFYQIQYKERNASSWRGEPLSPLPHPSSSLGEVKGLDHGVAYTVRVVLIDGTGASVAGDEAPSTDVVTDCLVPGTSDFLAFSDNLEYVKQVEVSEAGVLEIQWKFPAGNASTWCPLTGYEVHIKMAVRWAIHAVDADVTSQRVSGLLEGESYAVKVREVTNRGPSAFSDTLFADTLVRS